MTGVQTCALPICKDNPRVSDWSFPNNNHIVTPGRTKNSPWVHRGVWNVPIDDAHTAKIGVYAIQSEGPEKDAETLAHFDAHGDYNPADHHDALFSGEGWPSDPSLELTPAQDYVAMRGQGSIADRAHERLGKSDAGIVLLRRIFWREIEAMRMADQARFRLLPMRLQDVPIEEFAALEAAFAQARNEIFFETYIFYDDPLLKMADDQKVITYPYDPTKAMQLFAEAGWTKGADKLLHNAAGESVVFRCCRLTSADSNDDAFPGDVRSTSRFWMTSFPR